MSGNTLPLAPDARLLGKYEVLCRLSTGGMAEIFLASQRGLAGFRKLVVLKQILPDIRGEEEFVRMFLNEAKVTAAFNHPHIAHVYDLDVADGELFLCMEFVPGATLVEVARACLQAGIAIPMGYSLMAVRDTAVALHYAHTFTDPLGRTSPVIHRDVAEKNIMVTYEGVTKLLDFGIAKSLARASRTAVGMVKGTSGYMSPEQIMGEPLDARSDLFSLGVVLHECLTGVRLFYAKQADAMMNAVLRCEVAPPSRTNKQVPPELDTIVMRALARKREDRYATTLEFARALERAVGPHIWHPEQSSELMISLFADRREQTRQLLMSGQADTNDNTGELNVAQMLAMGSESAEPAGGTGAPPSTRSSVSGLKAPVPVKPATPQGAPASRRPAMSTPMPSAPDEGNARKALTQPPQKRVPARATPGESARPPPPPAEAMASPPAHKPEHPVARKQPGMPTLPLEHGGSAQSSVPPTDEATSRLGPRGAAEPSTSSDEPQRGDPRPRASRTQEAMRAVMPAEVPARGATEEPARVRSSRTQENLRITAPLPPPAERDEQTAKMRPPVPPAERDAQTAMMRPPAPPVEREVQTASRSGARPEDEGRTHPNRRRQSLPPTPHPEPGDSDTVPVLSSEDEDSQGAALGDDDEHASTLRGMHSPPREQRSRVWVAAAGVLVLLGAGAVTVILGLNGGRLSAWVKPMLGLGPSVGAGKVDPTPAVDTARTNAAPEAPTAGSKPTDRPSAATAAETPTDVPQTEKAIKRTREAPARKPRASEAPAATAGTEASSEDAPAAKHGLLSLVTEPSAKVFLGSHELGDTPLIEVKLPPGKHVLRLVDGEGKALRLPVEIKPGETTAVSIPLEMLPQQ